MSVSSPVLTAKRSRRPVWALALAGAAAGALLVISGAAVSIHATRDVAPDYEFEVVALGLPLHREAVASTDELRPRMRAWGYGLAMGFALAGAGIGAGLGWACCGRTKRCT